MIAVENSSALEVQGKHARDGVVLLYDQFSPDETLNLGFSNGIHGGESVAKDFSPYKELKCYVIFADRVAVCGHLTLNAPIVSYYSCFIDNLDKEPGGKDSDLDWFCANIIVNQAKSELNILDMGYFGIWKADGKMTAWRDRTINGSYSSGYYIYRIEGIPA